MNKQKLTKLLSTICFLLFANMGFAETPAPCGIICPNDITVDLGAGESEAIVDYAVTTEGLCELTFDEVVTNGFTGAFDIPTALTVFNNGDEDGGTLNTQLQNLDCISFVGSTSLIMSSADLFFGGNECTSFGTVVEFEVPADGIIEFDYTSTSNDTGDFESWLP